MAVMMKKPWFYVAVSFFLFPSSTYSQVEDGIYVIPNLDAYLVILSNNDIVKSYLFSLDGTDSWWVTSEGSRVGDKVEMIQTTQSDIAAVVVESSGLGLRMTDIYCNPYPSDNENGCKALEPTVSVFPVLKANGNLKAIYQTQFGADYVVFESDGVGVLLAFEYQEDLSDRGWIGAYTGILNDELTFTAQETAAESLPSEDEEFTLEFNLQISDLTNPQASFVNFSCIDNRPNPSERGCEYLEEIYFSKLIRKF